MIINKWGFFVCLFLVVFSFNSCKKNNSNIPYVQVDLYIYPSQPSYANLNGIGGWVYVSGGVKGLIVYRKSNNEFNAYERNCTFDSNAECAQVEVTNDNLTIVDSCCGSKFIIVDGSIINGPAVQPLLQYQTTWDGSTLHIFN